MIYFDNSATTKPHKDVLETFTKVSSQYFGNPSSIHSLGLEAENLLRAARMQMATLLGVKEQEIVFTSGGTEGNNFSIKGVAYKYHSRGKHIITTSIEHPSVHNPVLQLEKEGFDVTFLPVGMDGRVRLEDVEKALRDDTILVSMIHVNNEIGTIQPIEEIGRMLQKYPKVLFHVDHVQGIGKVPLNIHENHIDLLTISAHKFHGLKGTGALIVREGLKIEPLLAGGEQERGLRSGTENVAGIAAMAKALRIALEDVSGKINRMKEIREYIRTELENVEGITINTPKEHVAPHIFNFSVAGFKTEVLVHEIAERGVFVSTTSACNSKKNEPSKTLLAMGKDKEIAQSPIRISLSYENTLDEANKAVNVIKDSINHLKKSMGRL